MEQNKQIIRTKVNDCFKEVMGRDNVVPLQVSKLSTTSSSNIIHQSFGT